MVYSNQGMAIFLGQNITKNFFPQKSVRYAVQNFKYIQHILLMPIQSIQIQLAKFVATFTH